MPIYPSSTVPVALTKTNPGALTLSGSNSYSGGTTISAGTIKIGNSSALGSDGLTVNGGTLDLNGNSISVTALSGTGGIIKDNSGSASSTKTLTVNTSTTNTPPFAGSLNNDGTHDKLALNKSGYGTLSLSGSNNYSGGTTINAGTLQIGNISALVLIQANINRLSADEIQKTRKPSRNMSV